jgi:hypothetical protein
MKTSVFRCRPQGRHPFRTDRQLLQRYFDTPVAYADGGDMWIALKQAPVRGRFASARARMALPINGRPLVADRSLAQELLED